jgi:hypothetical protein
MAWNPSPKVATCREVAKKYGKRQVIILMLDDDTLEYASYGETPALCNDAKILADVAYEAVMRNLGSL